MHHTTVSCTLFTRLQYNMPFYLTYIASWPDLCTTAESPSGTIMSYSA